MTIKQQLISDLSSAIKKMGFLDITTEVEYPADPTRGDYSTNVALIAANKLGKNPMELAEQICKELEINSKNLGIFEKIDIAKPGFINFWLSNEFLKQQVEIREFNPLESTTLSGKKIFVEYAHPNTHKEMHIGHMRTLITGEALARLFEYAGAKVYRANYQGDIGPHIARALYGIEKLMKERGLSLEQIETWSNKAKTHFLGEGYVRGNQDYETQKELIDGLNKKLYARDDSVLELYQRTRTWNLDYYDEFYNRFYTKFDRLFFESEMDEEGTRIVQKHIPAVFKKENNAVIFSGDKYGLHTRVFITSAGTPTYEAKEMANAFMQYEAFPFDKNIHVVASEQAGYFQVVFKALELIDPKKFKDTEYHLSMGMVQLKNKKMSSRTGDILTVDWLLDQVKKQAEQLSGEGRIATEEKEQTIEKIVIGAVKYSVMQVGTGQNVVFDINKSVSLEGNSGPYIQYVYARTQSVLAKLTHKSLEYNSNNNLKIKPEERNLLQLLIKFDEVVQEAAERSAPSGLTTFLFDLAHTFNLFYQLYPILKAKGDSRDFRLSLTYGTGEVIKKGLELLGIAAPNVM